MKILNKLYTKTFFEKEKATEFIEKHKDQSQFVLECHLLPLCWTVSKYTNWNE